MRLSLYRAALAACLVCVSGPAIAWAQAPAPRPAAAPAGAAPGGTNVAVIDVALIFKHHDRFNAAMGDIKRDIDKFEAYVNDERKKLAARVEELKEFNPTSPDYAAKEGELARVQSELQVQMTLKRKEFLQQEARVYYRVYKEIESSVAVMAQRFRIGLVLRFNSDDMTEDDRASVLQGVNKAVVWHGNLDITPQIITDLNRRPFNPNEKPIAPATTPGGAVPGGQATRPPVIPGRAPVPR